MTGSTDGRSPGAPLRLAVGRIGRAHGIRGEVSVEVRTDDPETRFAPGAVLLTEPAERGPLTVRQGRVQSGRLIVTFDGVADRDAAEALRDTLLSVDVDPAESPDDPDEFYDHQLVGLAAVGTAGEPLGHVHDVLHLPAQDLLSVRTPEGAEVLVPFVAAIVPTVDLAAGHVVVDPPPGLFTPDGDLAPDGDA